MHDLQVQSLRATVTKLEAKLQEAQADTLTLAEEFDERYGNNIAELQELLEQADAQAHSDADREAVLMDDLEQQRQLVLRAQARVTQLEVGLCLLKLPI